MTAIAERAWVVDAACAKTGLPDLWSSSCIQSDVARHICLAHCPVLAQCQAEVDHYAAAESRWAAYRDVVMAGVAYDQNGRPLARQDVRRACWLCSDLLAKPEPAFCNRPPVGEHGTSVGYSRHKVAHEAVCDACKEWRRSHTRQRKIDAQVGRT